MFSMYHNNNVTITSLTGDYHNGYECRREIGVLNSLYTNNFGKGINSFSSSFFLDWTVRHSRHSCIG